MFVTINMKLTFLPADVVQSAECGGMGVKGLWEVVSPTGELMCLASLAGKAVAVDLASWLVDTQSLQLGHFITRPHLRFVVLK